MELIFGSNTKGFNDYGQSESEFRPYPGGPFSAVIPSMWPKNLIEKLQQDDEADTPEYRYDEFGFRVDEEDGTEEYSSKVLGIPLVDDPQHKLQWQAHLEFALNSNVENLTWDKVGLTIPRSEKLSQLVRAGIPHSIRAQIWVRLSGALQKRSQSDATYREIVEASLTDSTVAIKAIEKDLLRTIPNNACFSNIDSPGISPLRKILRALAWLYPDNGYCQGTGMIISHLLLIMPEEFAFWTMCAIIETLVPASYFNNSLLGVHADQRSLRQLMMQYLPKIDSLLRDHDIELSLISLHWFITLFAGVLHTKVLLRVWDLFFLDGSIVLFRIAMGMLKLKENIFEGIDNSADIFNCLSDIPSLIDDADQLFEVSMKTAGSLTTVVLETHRRKHTAFLIAEQGKRSGSNTTQPRKQMLRRRSFIGKVLFGSSIDGEYEHDKAKNIVQTELVASLRKTIKTIMKHFQDDDEDGDMNMEPDYSMQSHGKDHEDYLTVSLNKKRRAKALMNFERHDESELGFKKNDIITIISTKDEHCWIGELNGLRGWFPAKLVHMLDERSKTYTTAGDDSISTAITDLVRGGLCPALQSIMEHGLKRPMLLGTACHPWQFIEEVANHEVEKDFESVFSRLVLCKTFRYALVYTSVNTPIKSMRLDEEGKVLTPEELLYRCVQSVNMTHENVQMDVKLRSLVCLGLNEQVLHLWLEVLCSCEPVVNKWYQPWSFIRSPGWVLLKCELRVLAKTTFYLSQDWELPQKKTGESLREGVRDMLVKHHLFSWDI